MENELLNKIFEKLVSMESNNKKEFEEVNKRLDSIKEQVVKNSESITDLTKLKSDIITQEHHFNIIDRQLTNHAIELDKLKSR